MNSEFLLLASDYADTPVVQPSNFPWMTVGKLFYDANGNPVTFRGFSGFKLLNLYESGKDIKGFLDQFNGYNNIRIFLQTEWGQDSWQYPSNSAAYDFLKYLKDRGLAASFVLATSNGNYLVDNATRLVNFLKGKVNNLFLEGVNEPGIYDKLDPSRIRHLLETSGFPYSSGWYIDTANHYGNHWRDHSPRVIPGWQSKGGHNLYEGYKGGGPNYEGEPALKQPCIEDEPIKPQECNYDIRSFYEYSASCVLLGAGATFHCEQGKWCSNLDTATSECKDAFLRGLNVFPTIDYFDYRRIVEAGQSDYARTYVNGSYSIRIAQNGTSHPEPGWKPLDNLGICWSR